MSLDFTEIKRISIVEVVSGHYKIPLRYRGDYANAPCPLPTHKDGDKGKSLSIHLGHNYWRCFSESCNTNNGGKKGGDVINFVAAMENCREKEAAEKLAEWFHVGKEKPVTHMEKRADNQPSIHHQSNYQDSNTGSGSVKYMAEIDAWYDVTFVRLPNEPDEAYRKRTLNAIKGRLIESFRNGKAAIAK